MPVRPPSDSTRATTLVPPRSRPNSSSSSSSSSSSFASYRESSALSVFALLLAFRIVNALTLRTFFQPDEYFQSLEPAWQLAFGADSHAWITWEWRSQLRSCLHPALFAAVYQAAAKLSELCALTASAEATLFIAAPKIAQAVFAALLDLYTWKLSEKVYGQRSSIAFTTLALSVCSPWQWFCTTRTLSNCLETTMTSIAVYHWPWHWPGHGEILDKNQKSKSYAGQDLLGSFSDLRLSLVLAAFACILRPTNILIWVGISLPTFWQASSRLRIMLVREIFFCGSAVLACSVLSDKAYYGVWTLPPLRFLYFNIAQSLAVFYGKNRPDYYLTEGLPLLLTTALPFAMVGLWQALAQGSVQKATNFSSSAARDELLTSQRILTGLAYTSLFMTLALSTISHKEVRFLYPILPFLHVLASRSLCTCFRPRTLSRRVALALLLGANLLISGYTSQVHQRGVIDVLDYLRYKHETQLQASKEVKTTTTVGFLMPCHSTPWRSHLVHSGIEAWALTCEPPLDVPLSERHTYLDEADRFYKNPGPADWLVENMAPVNEGLRKNFRSGNIDIEDDGESKRKWPQNVVFFEHLEPVINEVLGRSRYRECWRGFNTHFHDDSRRVGDVIVWCRD